MWAMIAGFLGVPLFKFGATALPTVGPLFDTLSELPPAFLLSFTVGIAVSLTDDRGAPKDGRSDLDYAAGEGDG